MVPGDDAEACIAFLPANDAFGHIKDAMLRLEAQGWNERARLINQIHDALMFEIPDNLMDEAYPGDQGRDGTQERHPHRPGGRPRRAVD